MKMDDDLLVSYLLGEVSGKQAMEINLWCSANETNKNHFEQVKLIWEASLAIKYHGKPDAADSLKRLKLKVTERHLQPEHVIIGQKTSSSPFISKYLLMKVAAALCVIASCGWLFLHLFLPGEIQLNTQDLVKIDTLSDGSVVTLNKNTQLQFPEKFGGGKRNVSLFEGEAFFSIMPDKEKPFFIKAGGTTIKVVGTSFNVKNKNGDVEVIVETGIVEVSNQGSFISLKPGEKVWIKKNSRVLTKENNTDHLYSYYISKEFIADDTPLWRMVEVLNDAYDSHIIIGRKELKDLPLNTTFKNESLEDILLVISRTFNITIERRRNQIIFK